MKDFVSIFQKKHAETDKLADAGERLFALTALAREIGEKKGSLDFGQYALRDRRFKILMGAGILVGGGCTAVFATMLAPFVLPLGATLFYGLMGGAMGGVGAFATAGTSDTPGSFIWKKDYLRREVEIRELGYLQKRVMSDADFIIAEEDLIKIASSSKFEEAFDSFPVLRERFKNFARDEKERPQKEARLRVEKATQEAQARAQKEKAQSLRDTVLKHNVPFPPKDPPKPFGI